MTPKFYRTDAGRYQHHPGEKKDCSVRALATVCAIPYHDAHGLFKQMGRMDGCGFPVRKVISVLPAYGFAKLTFKPSLAVMDALRALGSEGRWIVCQPNHVFAYVDGVVYDDIHALNMTRLVHHAWRVWVA